MQQIGHEPNWAPSSMTLVRAAKELLKRTEATEDLIAFTEYTFDRYRTAPHHRLIAQHLERVERGEIDRLMLLVPPRHGKSELASKRFPAFYLGRHPHRQFISVSATAELAADFGRDVRNLIESAEYQVLFSTKLAEDSKAKGKWLRQMGASITPSASMALCWAVAAMSSSSMTLMPRCRKQCRSSLARTRGIGIPARFTIDCSPAAPLSSVITRCTRMISRAVCWQSRQTA